MAHLSSWQHGPGDSLAVVFLHAFPLHSGMWEDARVALGPDTNVVGFDVRGLGESPPSRHACLLEHWVDDLFSVLDERHIDRALLVGLSMGGYIALRATERDPGRVAGLFLADTQAAADSNEAKQKRATAINKLEAEGVAPYVEAFLQGALSPRTFRERPEVARRCASFALPQSVAVLACGLVGLATRGDTTESLARISVPTRLVVGEDDIITPPAVMRAMAERISESDFHVIPSAGHLSCLENPQVFNRLLVEHVRRVEALQP